ncbi:MAG: DNA polymerase III subunit alpha [Actinomycetota bacterium]|nr:DNA polymerase III subunit alpha [Actinomycetota bacterium]
MSAFVHLHVHSEFSLLDGAVRLKDLVAQAKELGMPAVAVTDHGTMYNCIDFYKKAIAGGVKPIFGCEVYVAPQSRFDKTARKDESNRHLTLLAQNLTGYRNLMKLVSSAYLDGFYYRPRVDMELLKEHHEGLIALSGCLSGELSKLILVGHIDEAKAKVREYLAIFGEDNYFIEIQDHGIPEQKQATGVLADIAKELGLGLVASNDVHYLRREDSTAHDVLLCIQTGSTLDEPDRMRFSTDQFYLKSAEEMAEVFPEYPEALANTVAIAERCNVELDLGRIHLPEYDVPEGKTLDSYLEELCRAGLAERYRPVTPEVVERLEYELGVIAKTGFSGYFLVVWDFIRFAKQNGIKVGPGRGSAAGSIVAYALGITNIDPIAHDLLFERFLNPERVSMPDIDIDFCYVRRQEVIRYVADKYGQDRVAQIITFSTMAARAAIRDAGRVFGVPYGHVDKIAKLIPEIPGTTLETALNSVEELKVAYETDEVTRRLLDTAQQLEGMVRQDSIHAAAVVIANDSLPNYAPIQKKPNTEVVTQYSMDAIKDIGLLKMDFLGLRTLTVIADAVTNIKRNHGVDLDVDSLALNDKKTFRLLQRAETIGLFQLESSGMRSLVRELAPTVFPDIVALLALYRPGPLQSGMVKDFVDCKHGRKIISYPHQMLEPFLKETYGIIVYQEQVMRVATEMAGFTMGEADILRGAMSKKKPEVLAKYREKFITGAKANGIDKKTAGKVFDLVNHFAGYGFNKSHSTAYAVISYQTAYLKAHYQAEFMAALLTSIMDNKDKVAQYVNECRRLKIEVLPPDVNESFREFAAVDTKRIRFGLSAVRNVGDGAIESIIAARGRHPFVSLDDFCERVDSSVLNKRALESLIKAGAFDSLGASRKYLLSVFEQSADAGVKRRRDLESGQGNLFVGVGAGDVKPAAPVLPPAAKQELPKPELLAFEKEMLGLYVSDNPLLELAPLLRAQTTTIAQARELRDGMTVSIGGLVGKISRINTRKGESMAFIIVEDLEGSIEVVVFPSILQKCRAIIAEDAIVKIKGRLDVKEDEVKLIAQEITPLKEAKTAQKQALYLKIGDDRLDKNLIAKLRKLLKDHPGDAEVFLRLGDGDKLTTLRFSTDFRVAGSGPLIGQLSGLLGDGSVTVA